MRARQIQRLVLALSFALVVTLCSVNAFTAQDKREAIDAEKIYMHECKDCHGEDGRGRMHGQPDFTNAKWQANVTDELMFKTIKFGREPMPFYVGALTDEEIQALVRYIRSLTAKPAVEPQAQAALSAVNTCISCHQQRGDDSVRLFAGSVHVRNAITCTGCHGGDYKARDKAAAHGANFIGKPSPVEQLAMCGKCHTQPQADFKASLHFPKNFDVPRLACSDCHGAHTVGSGARARDFSFAVFCTNCHGLEYLPELPAALRGLLQSSDDESRAVARWRAWGREPSDEVMAARREVRHRIGDLVHKTDLPRAVETAPEIMKLHQTFKSLTN
ncbi:MAG TPA: c-type cytochrome [Blastocatellia bacterium]|nr:c-type cytochrome [Blastocatellia bacterium]